MILVTAADGNGGKLLMPNLLASGANVLARVRSEASAAVLLRSPMKPAGNSDPKPVTRSE